MIARLTDALDFHAQALTLRAERQRLIASNIANADTPGYQARDFDFASALRAATGGAGLGQGGQAIARDVMTQGGRDALVLRYAVPSQTNLDSNTVDMDRERAAFSDSAVRYQATLQFINSSVRTTLESMRGPNQG
jgi:flagellar basal-body rod protein FlgB